MKALFYGVAIATMAGLLCGGAMKYHGRQDDDPAGPQMLVSGPSARDAEPWQEAALTGYSGEIPDYVVGSDWLRPVAYDDTSAPETEGSQAIRQAVRDTPAPYAPAAEQTTAVYPSVDGDILAGLGDDEAQAFQQARASDRLDAMNAQIAADSISASNRIAGGPS